MQLEVERIWEDDLFNRRSEAEQIEAYIESVSAQQLSRVNGTGYTLAIDAPYGVGKSFFLRRLAKHLKMRHPVAFVDAWADDLMDEPLTALVATLQLALKPYFSRSTLRTKWKTVLEVSGRVARIAAVGAVKKGVGMLITASAAEMLAELVKGAPDTFKDKTIDGAEGLGEDAIESAERAAHGEELMVARIFCALSGGKHILAPCVLPIVMQMVREYDGKNFISDQSELNIDLGGLLYFTNYEHHSANAVGMNILSTAKKLFEHEKNIPGNIRPVLSNDPLRQLIISACGQGNEYLKLLPLDQYK